MRCDSVVYLHPVPGSLVDVGGGLAQMVERSLSMREVPGSIPGFSIRTFFFLYHFQRYIIDTIHPLSFLFFAYR